MADDGQTKITVSANALQEVLIAFMGAPHRVLELRAIARMPDTPVNKLIHEYNAWVTEQMNKNDAGHVMVTKDNLQSFKHLRDEAVLHNQSSFMFGGQEITVVYAGYVIEHIEAGIKNG